MPINSFLYPGAKFTPVYEVANSLRYDDSSGDSLTRSQSSSPSSQRIFTFSAWVKRAHLNLGGSDPNIQFFSQHNDTTDRMDFRFQSGGTIDFFHNSPRIRITTNRLFRDVSAWYHVVLRIDTTQSTASDRARLYINGVQETSFSTADYGSQNADLGTNYSTFAVGDDSFGTGHFDGYFAEVVYCDGQSLDPTSFGEFDSDTNIWKPIDVSGLTFGTNGFYLDFENSSSLGADVSGNGNNFTANNLTSVDQSTDTCTNNFCTMNTLVPTSNVTFSQGNLKMVTDSSSSMGGSGIGTFGLNAGKWYWEIKIASLVANHNHGVISENTSELYTGATAMQNDTGVTCWRNDDGGEMVVDGSATSNDYGLFTDGQIMGIALDMDNYNISIYRNGSALVSDFNMSTTRGTIFPFINTGVNTTSEVNFGGTQSFTISSGNSDANGYGNFEYSVPSGYYSLCTKNLAEYG